jgi:peptide-methionine (R)-S-oxide reductase
MNTRPSRTVFLAALASSAGLWFLGLPGRAGTATAAEHYEVTMSDQEWQKKLTPSQYAVLRKKATEPAWTSPLLNEHEKGTFVCAGCENALFASAAKYDSGSGWPSFWQPIAKGAVGTSEDFDIGMERTEVHCARCGGHLGHVFDDGPAPTHLRYCMNGVALKFEAEKKA